MKLVKKRVYALYRVSTIGQVEKDDIPMQKQRCREYAEEQGWEIVQEFYEKGVSGFKVSAKDRDAIQEIQAAAAEGKFDILLVYMFDRLGRKDDETPFVVEWFVRNGIEVWSTMEGQQRFDSHVDKLMNYIRYWQASGESIKTSMRVKTRLGQLTEAGHYTGGSYPYGYRIERTGRLNKKNREVYDLVIDEQEAEIVRLIFHKYVDEGYGAQRICRYCYEHGISGRDGNGFPNTTVNRIIKNEMYIGNLKNGDTKVHLEELRIIDDTLFQRAQNIRVSRVRHHNSVPLNSKGKSLLVGNIYCAHCGWRLTLTTSGSWVKTLPDGTKKKEPKIRYECHYKKRHPGNCDGQSGYGVTKLDAMVERMIRMKFAEIKAAPAKKLIANRNSRELEAVKPRIATAKKTLKESQEAYDSIKKQAVEVFQGRSDMSMDFLNTLVQEAEENLQAAHDNLAALERYKLSLEASTRTAKAEYDQLLTWADGYDSSSFEAKKMIVSQLIKSVKVGRNYDVEIEFNISFEELQNVVRISEAELNAQIFLLPGKRSQNEAPTAEEEPEEALPDREYTFDNLITCSHCGKHFRQKAINEQVKWICPTFNKMGKSACPSQTIPHASLVRLVMNMPFEDIEEIIAMDDQTLEFRFLDDTKITKKWELKSRALSWTKEMKEAARKKATG